MPEYDWLQYNLTWFEKGPSERFAGEAVLIWPSRSLLLEHGVISAASDCIEGELPVASHHLKWLASISPVAIDLATYDYFVGVSGCCANS